MVRAEGVISPYTGSQSISGFGDTRIVSSADYGGLNIGKW